MMFYNKNIATLISSLNDDSLTEFQKDHHIAVDNLNRLGKVLDALMPPLTDKTLKRVKDTVVTGESTLRIGKYTICKTDNVYKLLDVDDDIILDNVVLYEAIYTIAAYLYQGKKFNSPEVVSVLEYSNRYDKHLYEAKMNKFNYDKYKANKDYDRMDIELAKFDENRIAAIRFRHKILNEYVNLGK